MLIEGILYSHTHFHKYIQHIRIAHFLDQVKGCAPIFGFDVEFGAKVGQVVQNAVENEIVVVCLVAGCFQCHMVHSSETMCVLHVDVALLFEQDHHNRLTSTAHSYHQGCLPFRSQPLIHIFTRQDVFLYSVDIVLFDARLEIDNFLILSCVLFILCFNGMIKSFNSWCFLLLHNVQDLGVTTIPLKKFDEILVAQFES